MNGDGFTNNWGRGILLGLQGRRMYGGEVPPEVKAKRRSKDKVAKASRKANRGR